ncbi:threonylcarbamoyl-AMP synthase [Pacificimonas flava]|uniref:Threonylcarbamoyl-AMP synthase n=2 Tax=Pacificimonas TaxID=1960290 RepID=A0A219B8X3_9SPHN|nr:MULTISPECIES: L-threonylcarbamoyladenylate synthase [Pacificimonas]MBZ6378143.1 threonylcarbamoyl-AMP synthase [Pacificimonas aurantium]OWV34576.1 threonylcarbamoyl-AMP synthase [Pacificimonas flava]
MPRLLSASDPEAISEAVSALGRGAPVVLPTETVYGLAADAANGEAVAKVYAVKGRPAFNPLIAHVSGPGMAADHADLSPLAERLMAEFWPGPLSLVLPRRKESTIAALVTAGLDTVALRMPAHPVPQKVITALGRPLAAPSANRTETISPTTAAHVVRSLGEDAPLIIDAGPCDVGLESTIVAVEGDRLVLLRPGTVTADRLSALAPLGFAQEDGGVRAPGMTKRHYAPSKALRLDAKTAKPGEFLIGFGDVEGDETLSETGDLAEAAARLFALLHVADRSDSTAIAVASVPGEGLGAAINDRLRRAASA